MLCVHTPGVNKHTFCHCECPAEAIFLCHSRLDPESIFCDTENMNKRGNALIIILAILAMVGLTLTGYFLWSNKQTPNKPVQTASPDSTANWKTYKGNSFSIKYPPDWEVTESYVDTIGNVPLLTNKKSPTEQIYAYLWDKKTSFGSIVKTVPQIKKIGDYTWEIRNSPENTGSVINGQTINTMERLYTIGDINNPRFAFNVTLPKGISETNSQVEQILSTFKFL